MDKFTDTEIMGWLLSSSDMLLSSSSDSSSSGDENSDKNNFNYKKRIPKLNNFVEDIVSIYTEHTFKQHFRLSRLTAYRLIERFNPCEYRFQSSNKMGSSSEKCVLLCLWYLANTESFGQISDRFDVALSTAHRILTTVINFIMTLRDEFIVWPNNEKKKKISIEFEKKHGFTNVIGCIDGSHIKIQKPLTDEDVYVNRKGYHSVLIQAICDHRKLFLDVYCGEAGSLHDARLLRKSSIYRKAENPQVFENFYLLGDSAYPSLAWLVPPFRDNGNLTEEQRTFNFKLSSTRMVIEHAFGLLKGRFRRLGHFENLNIKLIVKCIMAACVLHNICILENDLMEEVEQNIQAEADDSNEDSGMSTTSGLLGTDKRAEVFGEMLKFL